MQEKEGNEIDTVMSSYYGEEQVTAIINLKVDTKAADTIAEKVAKYALVEDVFLVTGDTDIVVKTKFHNYNQLKRFLVDDISEHRRREGHEDADGGHDLQGKRKDHIRITGAEQIGFD